MYLIYTVPRNIIQQGKTRFITVSPQTGTTVLLKSWSMMTCPLYLQLCSIDQSHSIYILPQIIHRALIDHRRKVILYYTVTNIVIQPRGMVIWRDVMMLWRSFAWKLDHEESFVGNSRHVELYANTCRSIRKSQTT